MKVAHYKSKKKEEKERRRSEEKLNIINVSIIHARYLKDAEAKKRTLTFDAKGHSADIASAVSLNDK